MNKKARFECRLDPNAHARLKELADETGVSMNQIIEGVLVWAADRAYPGLPSPHPNGNGYYESHEAEPAVWFGFDGFDDKGVPVGGGQVIFALNFAPSRAVIEGREV